MNALSNFVADARGVIGFDPHERLVDYLLSRAAQSESKALRAKRRHRGRRRGRRDCQSGGWGSDRQWGASRDAIRRPGCRCSARARNVPDEQMETSWNYVKRLACRSEEIGFDLVS